MRENVSKTRMVNKGGVAFFAEPPPWLLLNKIIFVSQVPFDSNFVFEEKKAPTIILFKSKLKIKKKFK